MDRVGADHEDEAVRALDGRAQRGREHLAVADALGVDPDLFAACLERVDQPPNELGVPPRVREEDVGHPELSEPTLREPAEAVRAGPVEPGPQRRAGLLGHARLQVHVGARAALGAAPDLRSAQLGAHERLVVGAALAQVEGRGPADAYGRPAPPPPPVDVLDLDRGVTSAPDLLRPGCAPADLDDVVQETLRAEYDLTAGVRRPVDRCRPAARAERERADSEGCGASAPQARSGSPGRSACGRRSSWARPSPASA